MVWDVLTAVIYYLGLKVNNKPNLKECLMDINRTEWNALNLVSILMIDFYINAVRSRKKLQQRADLC